MINKIKIILVLTILIISIKTANSQTDSITISKESPDSIDFKYERIYKLFLEENNREIKHLWKIDLLSFSLLAPNFGFEQKFWKIFSSETSMQFGFYQPFYSNTVVLYKTEQAFTYRYWDYFHFGTNETLKYYYNLNRRERLLKNTNGFSADYFSLMLGGNYIFYNLLQPDYHKQFRFTYGFGYGLQRRIGNIGFIEPTAAVNWYPEHKNEIVDYTASIGLKVGFAIESFSNLRHMLKK